MATIKETLYALVLNKLPDGNRIPATDHRDVENAIIAALIDNETIQDILAAYSYGTTYFWNTTTERDAQVDMSNGERGLVIDERKVYEYTNPPGTWVLYGELDSLPDVTLNSLIEVSNNDSTPGYLEAKLIVNDNNGINISDFLEFETLNDGADEVRQLNFDVSKLTSFLIPDLGIGFFETTVGDSSLGSGGQDGVYTTLAAAAAAGFRRIKVIGSTLETTNTIVNGTKPLVIEAVSKNYIIDFDDNIITVTTGNLPSVIFKNATLEYNYTSAKRLTITNANNFLHFENCKITDNSSVTGTYVMYVNVEDSKYKFDNCELISNNNNKSLLYFGTNILNTYTTKSGFYNCAFTGAGASCRLENAFKGVVQDCQFFGEWEFVTFYYKATNVNFAVPNKTAAIVPFIRCVDADSIYAPNSDIAIQPPYFSPNYLGVTNSEFKTIGTVYSTTSFRFSNVKLNNTATLTLTSSHNLAIFDKCVFADNVVVASGANDIMFEKCHFGVNLAAGKNLVINSGALGTHAISNKSGIAIVNSDASSQVANNSIFNV